MVSSALLIGLGNIGCKYDLESEEILTHLKAMVLSNAIKKIHVYDSNLKFSKIISSNFIATSPILRRGAGVTHYCSSLFAFNI